ncbi:MAG TPA: hypothetical protein VEZ42_19170, partial [Pseudonocardia sp.]|nr:hypothetical protein [Pseudonocardia sp.]
MLRILRCHRLPYPCDCDALTGQLVRTSRTTAARYERAHPASWCAGTSRRSGAFLRTDAIDRIERVMTDKARTYRYSLRQVVADPRVRQVFIS